MKVSEIKKRRNRLPQKGCVYCLSFPNGKSYIGITQHSTPIHRIKDHRKAKSLLGRAIRKYGSSNMRIQILFMSYSWSKLKELEIWYIKELKTKVPNGYNITEGGEGSRGFTQPKKVRRMMSLRLIGNKHMLGHKHSKESRRKMIESHKLSERREAISKGLRKKWKDPVWKKKMLKILKNNNKKRGGKNVRKEHVGASQKSSKGA